MENVAHLTIGIKFSVSFMRNIVFIKRFLTSTTLTSQIANLKMQTYLIFQDLYGLKVSVILSKF